MNLYWQGRHLVHDLNRKGVQSFMCPCLEMFPTDDPNMALADPKQGNYKGLMAGAPFGEWAVFPNTS